MLANVAVFNTKRDLCTNQRWTLLIIHISYEYSTETLCGFKNADSLDEHPFITCWACSPAILRPSEQADGDKYVPGYVQLVVYCFTMKNLEINLNPNE